jgi:hypothetical protein
VQRRQEHFHAQSQKKSLQILVWGALHCLVWATREGFPIEKGNFSSNRAIFDHLQAPTRCAPIEGSFFDAHLEMYGS